MLADVLNPVCSVGFTGTPGDGGHIKPSAMYTFTWLPKGYGPSMEDRTICVLFDPHMVLEGELSKGMRHPLIESIAHAIETYLKEHPEPLGFKENQKNRPQRRPLGRMLKRK